MSEEEYNSRVRTEEVPPETLEETHHLNREAVTGWGLETWGHV